MAPSEVANNNMAPIAATPVPTPISARAVYPHGIGSCFPDIVVTHNPSGCSSVGTSHTGAKVHGAAAIKTPIITKINAGIISFLESFIHNDCKYVILNNFIN
jgi:hypothetical protein